MKIHQRIEKNGPNLVLIIYLSNGKELARRVWEGAGNYVRGENVDPKSGLQYMILAVPIEAQLRARPPRKNQ